LTDWLADDVFLEKPEELNGAGARVLAITVVIDDQDRGTEMVYECLKKQLKLFGTVLREPICNLRLRGFGIQ
jgi:hypothetical protein